MKLHLHIERLVVDAPLLRANESWPLQQAVQAELARLFREGGAPPQSHLRLTSHFDVARNSNPERLGAQIAGAVHHSMKGGSK